MLFCGIKRHGVFTKRANRCTNEMALGDASMGICIAQSIFLRILYFFGFCSFFYLSDKTLAKKQNYFLRHFVVGFSICSWMGCHHVVSSRILVIAVQDRRLQMLGTCNNSQSIGDREPPLSLGKEGSNFTVNRFEGCVFGCVWVV